MTRIPFFGRHRSWEDWASMLLGILAGLSPWLSGQMGTQTVMVNAIFIGVLIFLLAEYELADLRRWYEVAEIAVGCWLAASPFLFGYATEGTLRFWHFALGAAVVLLAGFELLQDWGLNREELARHGDPG